MDGWELELMNAERKAAEDHRAAVKALEAYRVSKAPVKVGDTVRTKDGKVYRVTELRARYGAVTIGGVLRKKNGQWGKAVHCVWPDWEKVNVDGE